MKTFLTLLLLVAGVAAYGGITLTKVKGPIYCCELISLRWDYDDPNSWTGSDTVNVELWMHHTLTPNKQIGVIVSNLPCKLSGNAGFDWRVPQTFPFAVQPTDDVYFKIVKSTDPNVSSESRFSSPDTVNVVQCPSPVACLTSPPTPSPTPLATPAPPTPLPTDNDSSTTTTVIAATTTITSSATATGNNGTPAPATTPSSGNGSGAASTSTGVSSSSSASAISVTNSTDGDSESMMHDACMPAKTCSDCVAGSNCFWCADDSVVLGGCHSIASGGGWLGPQNALTHIVPNLFADDGLTCQNWNYGQCNMPGRQLVFIVGGCTLGALFLICVGGILACCCRGKCGKKARNTTANAAASTDNVPLLSNTTDVDEIYSEDDLDATTNSQPKL